MLSNKLPPDLIVATGNLDTPLDIVLRKPQIPRAIKLGNPTVIKYFQHHAQDLYKLIMKDDDNITTSQSFIILSSNDTSILQNVFVGDLFRDIAVEVLSNKDVSAHVLGRLSSITLSALLSFPSVSCPKCGFIYHLLSHCANPSVFNLFEVICGDDPRCPPTQQWLLEMGFETYILREIESIDFSYKSDLNPHFDLIYEKVYCLYQLISQCASNEILGPSFHSPTLIDSLSKNFDPEPTHLKNARWRAINSTLSQATAAQMTKFIPNALNLLTNDFQQLKSYRVSAIEFMTQMMSFAPLTYDMLNQSNVLQSLMNTVVTFSNSSILHNSFTQFVKIGLNNEQFAEKIIRVLTPFLVDVCTQRSNRVFSPYCFQIIQLFVDKARQNENLKMALKEVIDINAFLKGPLNDYLKVTTEPYGGVKPKSIFHSLKAMFVS